MKTSYLFPHRLKTISGILFVLSFIMFVSFYAFDQYGHFEYKAKVFAIIGNDGFLGDNDFFGWIENSILDEILATFVIVSGIVFAFAKEKYEDEMVQSIRLHSLAWATIANYGILLLCYLFVYGLPFLNVLMGAMFSHLLIFIVLFRYKMYRFNTTRQDEE